jgi:hypothetical protein
MASSQYVEEVIDTLIALASSSLLSRFYAENPNYVEIDNQPHVPLPFNLDTTLLLIVNSLIERSEASGIPLNDEWKNESKQLVVHFLMNSLLLSRGFYTITPPDVNIASAIIDALNGEDDL